MAKIEIEKVSEIAKELEISPDVFLSEAVQLFF